MSSRLAFVRLAAVSLVATAVDPAISCAETGVPAPIPTSDPAADALFRRAKDVWRDRADPPYLTYAMRERYVWREKAHETWWHASFRLADRRVALERVVVPEEETARLKGSAIGIHIRYHQHNGPTSFDLDTNPNADAFPVLDPLIDPIGAFGMRRTTDAVLLGATPAPLVAPSGTPAPEIASLGAPATPAALTEIAHVEAVSRDYRITDAGLETLPSGTARHLVLVPLRDPYRNRLRDLWIDPRDAVTLRLAVHGLFTGAPYDTARWLVDYVRLDGRTYVQQISTGDPLRFGPEHVVDDFAFDFVGYAFPPTLPESLFTKLL